MRRDVQDYAGAQSFAASSNFANSNAGATVQPTRLHLPVLFVVILGPTYIKIAAMQ